MGRLNTRPKSRHTEGARLRVSVGAPRATVDSCLRVSLLSDVPVQGRRRSPAEWRIDLGSNTSSWIRWLINRGGQCVPLRSSAPIWKDASVVWNKDG